MVRGMPWHRALNSTRTRGRRRSGSLKAALALALTLLASSATLALDPALDVTQYVQQTWTTQEGLPQNTVSALLQTPDGYLWFGTEEGLVRFDGGSFTVFDKTNVRLLRDNAVACSVERSLGGPVDRHLGR